MPRIRYRLIHRPTDVPGQLDCRFVIGAIPRPAQHQDRAGNPIKLPTEVQRFHGPRQPYHFLPAQPHLRKGMRGKQPKQKILQPQQPLWHLILRRNQHQCVYASRKCDGILQREHRAKR